MTEAMKYRLSALLGTLAEAADSLRDQLLHAEQVFNAAKCTLVQVRERAASAQEAHAHLERLMEMMEAPGWADPPHGNDAIERRLLKRA
jgi:uncharacterized membrane protein YccC